MKPRALAVLVVPFLAACGVLIGAEWDATLREAQLDGAPGGDDADTEVDAGGSDAMSAADTRDARDAAPIPKTCSGDAKYCVCRANQPKLDGGVLCSVASVTPGGFCCQDKNWPISGKCVCSEFKCGRTDPTYCSCGPLIPDAGLTSCSGAVCCYSALVAGCNCFDTGIQECLLINGDEVRVSSCTVGTVPCAANERRTDDCGFVTAQ